MKAEAVMLLVNLASIMQRADESLLPGVYKEVGASLHTDPTGLGSRTLFRSIVQSACYPLAAYLAMRHNRAHVIALGAFLWAAATFLVGFSPTFLQIKDMDLLVAGLFQEVKHPIMNKTSPSPCPSLNDDLLVAGMFQEVKHPTMNKTSPCLSLNDDSSGNTSNKTAAKGMVEPEVISNVILYA